MELINELNKIILEFRRSLKLDKNNNFDFDYALLLHSIDQGYHRTCDLSRKVCKDTSYVSRHLISMENDGYLTKENNQYKITTKGEELLDLISKEQENFINSIKSDDIQELIKFAADRSQI